MSWSILCESADLAAQSLSAARAIGLSSEASAPEDWRAHALARIEDGQPTALAYLGAPTLDELVELAHASRVRSVPVALAIPVSSDERAALFDVAGELGLCAVAELRPLCAALALLGCGAAAAVSASARELGPADRARLRGVLLSASAAHGQFVARDAGGLAFLAAPEQTPIAVGDVADLIEALHALRRMQAVQIQVVSSVEDVDARAVLDVIFGPRRALSDPASKAALAPYGIPLPVEELCGSPSRAAAEAARIGYPVRISLASPDLRVWDHPDLSVDAIDNAASVRDTFRQLQAAAQTQDPAAAARGEPRVLGVLVTASNDALALLRVRATPLPRERIAVEIGFADPHGRAARDRTTTILPSEPAAIERALRRLDGADLLFAATSSERKTRLEAIADVLLRVAAFLHDRRREIEAVELQPLAVLLDGNVEVREACVSVSDWFERNS
jgi:acetyltransferase